MYNDMEKKKSSSIVIIIVVILSVLVLGLGGYIVYDKVLKGNDKQEEKEQEDKKEEEKEDNKNSGKLSEGKINKLLVDLPYYWFSSVEDEPMKIGLFTNSKVTFDNLNQNVLLSRLTKETSFDNKKESSTSCRAALNEQDVKNVLGNYESVVLDASHCISLDNLRQISKEMYNNDNFNLKENELIPIPGGASIFYKGKVYFYHGAGATAIKKQTIDYKYEESSDELYVYEKMVLFTDGLTYEGNTMKSPCYSDEVSKSFATIDITSNMWIGDTDINYDFSKYNESLKEYKHTFKKNSSGNYYWYSTEPFSY